MEAKITLLTLLILGQKLTSAQDPSALPSMMKFLSDFVKYNMDEVSDTKNFRGSYDFIIVGGGSAGCVLANRLTEVKDWNILLIEAGRSENMILDVPAVAPFIQFTPYSKMYYSQPTDKACLGMKNGQCALPRGRVLGGSSTTNLMIYARGDASDYDNWAQMGNKGWAWDDVLPYFMKSEDMRINEDWIDRKAHGYGGYLSIDTSPYRPPIVKGFVQAGKELGYEERDYNSGNLSGFSFIQSTTKNGARMSANVAFLHPIRNRKNLHVIKEATVTKILIENNKAIGVEFIKNSNKYTVKAKREVILSAGAINSPQILMLSGIGPEDHLNSLGIEVIKNLPVGYNLMDHPVIGYVIFTVDQNDTINEEMLYDSIDHFKSYSLKRNGPASSNYIEGMAFVDVFNPGSMKTVPNLEIQFEIASPFSTGLISTEYNTIPEVADFYKNIRAKHSCAMFMCVCRPKSKGRITLKNTSPLSDPLIDIGYFNDPHDVEVLARGVEFTKLMLQTEALRKFNSKLVDDPIPNCAHHGRDTRDYWKCHAKHLTISNYHQCGTCKMGPVNDRTSVVDPRLRVHGIKRLRVIDASVIPVITSANTNAPTIMIAEKGADMIKEDWRRKGRSN